MDNRSISHQYLGVRYYDPWMDIFLTEDIQIMAVMPDI